MSSGHERSGRHRDAAGRGRGHPVDPGPDGGRALTAGADDRMPDAGLEVAIAAARAGGDALAATDRATLTSPSRTPRTHDDLGRPGVAGRRRRRDPQRVPRAPRGGRGGSVPGTRPATHPGTSTASTAPPTSPTGSPGTACPWRCGQATRCRRARSTTRCTAICSQAPVGAGRGSTGFTCESRLCGSCAARSSPPRSRPRTPRGSRSSSASWRAHGRRAASGSWARPRSCSPTSPPDT